MGGCSERHIFGLTWHPPLHVKKDRVPSPDGDAQTQPSRVLPGGKLHQQLLREEVQVTAGLAALWRPPTAYKRPPLSGLGLLFLRALGGHLLLAPGKEAPVARGKARAESAASRSFLALFSFKASPARGLPFAPQQKEPKAGDRRTGGPAEASGKPTGRRRRALGSCSFRRAACSSREVGVLWGVSIPFQGKVGRRRGENPPRKRPSPEFYSLRWEAAEEGGGGRPKPSSLG